MTNMLRILLTDEDRALLDSAFGPNTSTGLRTWALKEAERRLKRRKPKA